MRILRLKQCHFGLVTIASLIIVTLYMAFAFPNKIFHFKQSDTSQLKSVIIVSRNGETTLAEGDLIEDVLLATQTSQVWQSKLGFDELTNVGKERMYLVGKFLRLQYYERLLGGNPRKLSLRSVQKANAIESLQALAAGLNPPRGEWKWSDELSAWQPIVVSSKPLESDDLLSSQSECVKSDQLETEWKNSSSYALLLNEFRHDLQTLRQNTNLDFEDDLEMLANVEESLRNQNNFLAQNNTPSWYTSTYASRLAHIADKTLGCKFGADQQDTQRIYVGRLLHEILETLFDRIRLELTSSGATLLDDFDSDLPRQQGAAGGAATKKSRQQNEPPNVFVYMTDKQHLVALLNALQIYSSQPNFGALLIIELHFDPIEQVYFLRLFTVNAARHNLLPEPVRVNPVACGANLAECSPQQFKQNLRHLQLNKSAWRQLCSRRATASLPEAKSDSFTASTTLPPQTSGLALLATTPTTTPTPTTESHTRATQSEAIQTVSPEILAASTLATTLEPQLEQTAAAKLDVEVAPQTTTSAAKQETDLTVEQLVGGSLIVPTAKFAATGGQTN